MNISVKKEIFLFNNIDDLLFCSWVEFLLNWFEVIKEWNWLWEVYVYGFGIIFVFIVLFVVFYFIYFCKIIFFRYRVYLVVMNIVLLIVGVF